MKTQDTRKLPRVAAEVIRKKVVAAVEGGMSQKDAANLFGVTATSVCLWMKKYRELGESGLNTKQLGRHKGCKLTSEQAQGIRKSIIGKSPDQLKLPGFLWTRDLVAHLIEKRHNIHLSRWTVGRYMRSWGLSVQKPARRALEQNPEKVRYWLKTKYPQIKQQAQKECASIWWGDETGLRSDHQTGTTWGEKGRTPIVKKCGVRFSCNMISAITNHGDMRFMVYKEKFSSKIFINFLSRIIKSATSKVFLIIDNHSVHKSRRVLQWVEATNEHISLFFLPPYSPELNPDELLNQDLKNDARRHHRPATRHEMARNIRRFMSRRQHTPQTVQKYFIPERVSYAA